MSCHLHAGACDCPAYLIAMGENDRLLEADLEREEAKTVIALNVAAGDNKSSARIGAANSNPGLISKTTGGSQVTETYSIIPSQAQSAPPNPLECMAAAIIALDTAEHDWRGSVKHAREILYRGLEIDPLPTYSIDAPPFGSDEVAG